MAGLFLELSDLLFPDSCTTHTKGDILRAAIGMCGKRAA